MHVCWMQWISAVHAHRTKLSSLQTLRNVMNYGVFLLLTVRTMSTIYLRSQDHSIQMQGSHCSQVDYNLVFELNFTVLSLVYFISQEIRRKFSESMHDKKNANYQSIIKILFTFYSEHLHSRNCLGREKPNFYVHLFIVKALSRQQNSPGLTRSYTSVKPDRIFASP